MITAPVYTNNTPLDMKRTFHIVIFLAVVATFISTTLGSRLGHAGEPAEKQEKINKLLLMYDFYYLPFSVDFREGRSANDILPFMNSDKGGIGRLLTADELQSLDKEWNVIKENWKKKSLLLSSTTSLNQPLRISQHIISHRVPLNRTPYDMLGISDRIQLNEVMKSKPEEVQSAFKQMWFLKSFLGPQDQDKFNLFVVSASWCESSREYRMLFENYYKLYPNPNLNIHSIVVEDPKEEIFDAKILKLLFPHPKRYTHDSVPRFLAMETINGKTVVYEEGEALAETYERFFKQAHGFMDDKTTVFRQKGLAKKIRLDPTLSSVSK